MRKTVSAGDELGTHVERLSTGQNMVVPIGAVFENDRVRISIVADLIDGVPGCTRYEVERIDGGGLELLTTEVMRGVNLRALMMHALGTMNPDPDTVTAVFESLKRRRTPPTDKALRQFARDYRRDFVPGGMKEFAGSLGYSERQGWRLLKLARERGFLPTKEG